MPECAEFNCTPDATKLAEAKAWKGFNRRYQSENWQLTFSVFRSKR
jgi:hypothetical protein